MSEYGQQGTKYILGGESIFVNQEFLLATLMATIIVLKEISGDENTDIIIERVAEKIYEQITETEHGTTEERTGESGD
jgi:hypothetical protein